MAEINPARELQRLRERYAAMSDLELAKIARHAEELTEWARQALKEVMEKRGLQWDRDVPSGHAETNDRPVELRVYRDLPGAITDRMIMESADIECYLFTENMVRLDWLWSNLLGGVRLVVRRTEAEDAEKLLKADTIERFSVEGVGEYEQERCPQCGSFDVFCDELRKRIAGIGLLFGIPIAMTQRGWNCHDCGHTWQVVENAKEGTT